MKIIIFWKYILLLFVALLLICIFLYPTQTEKMTTKHVRFSDTVEIFDIPTRKYSFEYYL